ncbi:MAG: DASS family sodium-coupled anion symporter [Gammaproteobacteria bacterium]|nr:DASS family sodium-coupled anion symporter [Gammaproteobacteria bacterium]
MGNRQRIGLILGPLLFLLMLLLPQPEGMDPAAQAVAAVALLMTVWWITEAIPIPITALLPLGLFPALDAVPAPTVSSAYANHLIFLFLGGFLIAIAMERWELHRRIALHIVRLVGGSANGILLGFMLATAFLSMWISNTATVMMMLPIALAVARQAETSMGHTDDTPFPFGIALMLGIAYAGSIGGIATLIGTPPNAILAGVYEQNYGATILFVDWMLFALPLSVLMLGMVWLYLSRRVYGGRQGDLSGSRELVARQLTDLGPMTAEEKKVLVVFVLVALAWISHGFIDLPALDLVTDSTIAILGGIALFLIPAQRGSGRFLLDWSTAVKLPWDIILLFGGGFALAAGFQHTGLTAWMGEQLTLLTGVHMLFMVLAVTALVVFLTEVTSNTATASLMLPIMGALAAAAQMHPLSLMAPAALAASCAFMLPVATPPNAIVYSSRYVPILTMAKTGFWVNLFAIGFLTMFVMVWMPGVLLGD